MMAFQATAEGGDRFAIDPGYFWRIVLGRL